MKVENSQSFLSLYYEPGVVEVATGEMFGATPHEAWGRDTKSLGQVQTPVPIAKLMARWVMSAKPTNVLDPAAGLGTLLEACHRICKRAQLVGVERDAETLHRAMKHAPRGTKLILADYLRAEAGMFEGIIANPPYVKAQRLNYTEADWRYCEERFGTPLDRLTNLYALFLLKIWEDLTPGGRAAVLLPAEFLNANFGEEIKGRLLRELRPSGLIVFAPSLNLFKNALTTSAIVFLERRREVRRLLATKADSIDEANTFLDGLLTPSSAQSHVSYTDIANLAPHEKWLNVFVNGASVTGATHFARRVGDYFNCRRGIATGANDFFCLSESGLRKTGLGYDHVEPCITKAADAGGFVFSAEKFRGLVAADRRCYLLNPRRNGDALERYLQTGEQRGIPQRHLPSHRPTWYRPENRAVADIWVAVFSRENVKFILNTSGAKNLTCFHGLYAKKGCESLVPLLVLFLNSVGGREAFSKVNRFYGDGLNKLEPKDVEAMPCPELPPLSQAGAELLVQRLKKIESVAVTLRSEELEALSQEYFGPRPHGAMVRGRNT